MATTPFPALSISSHSLSNPLKFLPARTSRIPSPPGALTAPRTLVFPGQPSCRNIGRRSRNIGGISAEAATNREPIAPPYNVLITGSTKGIGYALAKEFLKAGDNVIVCSRSADRVESAVQNLKQEFGEHCVWGTVCDVREGKDVKALVSFAREKLNYIDIWINNAGSNAYSYKPLAETTDDDLMEVVATNTLGLMICCREAINMMLNQPRGGHVFNIDGAGSDGRPTPRFAAYGATKRSVVHLTKSLQMTAKTYTKFAEFQAQRRGEASTSGSTTGYSATCMVMLMQWVIDSGASDHMTGSVGMLHDYQSVGHVTYITVLNDSSLKVRGRGSIRLSSTLPHTSVLHILGNPFSLLFFRT